MLAISCSPCTRKWRVLSNTTDQRVLPEFLYEFYQISANLTVVGGGETNWQLAEISEKALKSLHFFSVDEHKDTGTPNNFCNICGPGLLVVVRDAIVKRQSWKVTIWSESPPEISDKLMTCLFKVSPCRTPMWSMTLWKKCNACEQPAAKVKTISWLRTVELVAWTIVH